MVKKACLWHEVRKYPRNYFFPIGALQIFHLVAMATTYKMAATDNSVGNIIGLVLDTIYISQVDCEQFKKMELLEIASNCAILNFKMTTIKLTISSVWI